MSRRRPKLAVWKFASCDGCQLSLLDCEDELLALGDAIDIAQFRELTRAAAKGPYDLSLIDGSITTAHDLEQIREVRRISRRLVTLGACASAGGIQALRNFKDVKGFLSLVYARPDYIDALATDPAFRRRGAARALLEAAEHEARERGLPAVSLDTTLTNEGARALYASAGYDEVAYRAPSRGLPGFVALVKPI